MCQKESQSQCSIALSKWRAVERWSPGFQFKIVDVLMTNFYQPWTTLLILVLTFAGIEPIRRAYEEAVNERYRFYSYGDTMLIL